MNVHIALMGKAKEPVLKGFQYYGMDKLYLLHSIDSDECPFGQVARDVKKALEGVGLSEIFLTQINPFDMQTVINSIIEIADKEKQADIYVNITGGTNLMAGAACSASFFIGAKAYYVLDRNKLPTKATLKDQIIELPIPKIPLFKQLQENQRKILQTLLEHNGSLGNTSLRVELGLSPQKLSYHLKELESKGLITTSRGLAKQEQPRKGKRKKVDLRQISVSLTNSGKLVGSWTT